MNAKEIICKIMEERHMNMTEMSLALKLNPKRVSQAINRENGMGMRLQTFVDWLERFDYQVVILSPDSDEEWLFDGESDE